MMNMNVENENKNMIGSTITDIQYFNSYTWRKEWVRPYESMFSILRNFCKVNVLNGRKALHLFGLRQTNNVSVFCPGLMMLSDSTTNLDCYQTLYSHLLPEWYLNQTSIFRKRGTEEKESLQISNTIIYCPECMKENYHSLLHNVIGTKRCPFHKIKLVQTDLLYATSSLYIDLHNKLGQWNIVNSILPCERTIKMSFYNQIQTPEYDYFLPVVRTTHFKADYQHQIDILIGAERKASRVITVTACNDTPAEFDKKFTEWFNSMQIPYDILKDDNRFLIPKPLLNHRLHFPQYYIDRYLLYKIYKSAKRMKLKHFLRKNSELLYIGDMNMDISYKQKTLIFCSFVYAVVSCERLHGSLRADWVDDTRSFFNFNNLRKNQDMHLAYLGYDIPEHFSTISNVDGINIALKILEDQYDFLYHEYERLAYMNGTINGYTGWKDMHLPQYYVTRIKGHTDFQIYRCERT